MKLSVSSCIVAAISLVAGAPLLAAPKPTTVPATNLVVSTWAPTGFLKNPVALTFDRDGRCYVAQTQRREGGEMQVKVHNEWILPDATFVTVDDRARWGGQGNVSWGEQTGGKQETITLLQDTKGSGHADKAGEYYIGFDRNINDILAGVLWFNGSVYATIAPDLWQLRDSQNTGHADDVRSISHGYAVHMSYSGHNMHGLTVGPDGKIYFSIGDKGLNVTAPDGRKFVYPDTGAVLRCNPDGSNFSVFAYGIRNLQEFAFDKYGNLFGVDNDGDYPTERERFVYVAEDSDTGWRFNWQYRSKKFDVEHEPAARSERYNVWMKEKMWQPYFAGQASYILPAISNYSDGPCGFKYATEGSLDPEDAGYFFLSQFPKALITAFTTKPSGASFTMVNEHIVSKGPQCTGLALGPDGALYGAEWGKSGFKLGNVGSVIKLDNPKTAGSELRVQTHKLLQEGPAKRSTVELIQLLNHADMRVRLDAQFELVNRKVVNDVPVTGKNVAFAPGLVTIALAVGPQMGRIHAMWGLGQLVDSKSLDVKTTTELASALAAKTFGDSDIEIRAAAVKLVGEIVRVNGPVVSDAAILPLLNDSSARVRYFAAMALRHFKDPKIVPLMFKMLAANEPMDTYIRHAAIMGLVGSGDVAAIREAAKHPSQLVRLGAVVALRRMADPGVAAFLNDADEAVVTEAARAIHDDDSIPAALPALAQIADRPRFNNEALLRRVLNANLRLGGADQIKRLVRYAVTDRNPAAMRVEAIDILATWEHPVINDRVEGKYRVWDKRSADEVKPEIDAQLAGLLSSKDATVSRAATRLIDELKIKTDDAVFAAWVADANKPAASRVAGLHLLANRKYAGLSASIDAALASKEPALRIEAISILATTDPARALEQIDQTLKSGGTPEKQAAYEILGGMGTAPAKAHLSSALDRVLIGKGNDAVELDIVEAATAAVAATPKTDDKELRKQIKRYNEMRQVKLPLSPYYSSLEGGDIERGREIFNGHPEAACVRCHSVDGSGSAVGPNLQGIGSKPDKTRQYILESMIDPNAFIVPGFGIEAITLKNGTDLSGQVKSETDGELQLLDLENKTVTVKKADIATRTPPVSIMPTMGAILSHREIRDVLAYVESLKN